MSVRRLLLALPFVVAAAVGAGAVLLVYVLDAIDQAEAPIPGGRRWLIRSSTSSSSTRSTSVIGSPSRAGGIATHEAARLALGIDR